MSALLAAFFYPISEGNRMRRRNTTNVVAAEVLEERVLLTALETLTANGVDYLIAPHGWTIIPAGYTDDAGADHYYEGAIPLRDAATDAGYTVQMVNQNYINDDGAVIELRIGIDLGPWNGEIYVTDGEGNEINASGHHFRDRMPKIPTDCDDGSGNWVTWEVFFDADDAAYHEEVLEGASNSGWDFYDSQGNAVNFVFPINPDLAAGEGAPNPNGTSDPYYYYDDGGNDDGVAPGGGGFDDTPADIIDEEPIGDTPADIIDSDAAFIEWPNGDPADVEEVDPVLEAAI